MELRIVAIVAIVLLSLGTIAGMVLMPDSAGTILGVTGPTIAVLLLLIKADDLNTTAKATHATAARTEAIAVETGHKVDGRMEQILALTQANAKSLGVIEGTTGVHQDLPAVTAPPAQPLLKAATEPDPTSEAKP